MANVTPISAIDTKVEFSTNSGSTWTDCSGFTGKVEWDGGDRDTGTNKVFSLDYSQVTLGKQNLYNATLTGYYSSGSASLAGDFLASGSAAFANRTNFDLRITPLGQQTSGSTGTPTFTTSGGYVTAPVWPRSFDSTSADGVMLEIRTAFQQMTKGTAA